MDIVARPIDDTNADGTETDDGYELLTTHAERTRDTMTGDTSDPSVSSVVGYLHDFGKVLPAYQSYIRNPNQELSAEERIAKNHSLLGAYAVEYALAMNGVDAKFRTLAFLSVAKHHSQPTNVRTNLESYAKLTQTEPKQRFETIKDKLKAVESDADSLACAEKLLKSATNETGSWNGFAHYVRQRGTHEQLNDFDHSPSTYANLLHLWSSLTHADKVTSARISPPSPTPPDPSNILTHIADFPKQPPGITRQLNEKRADAQTEATTRIPEFFENERNVATLTLPTGFGKTFTGLRAGLELANLTSGRLIYALPFTSIIDQVDETISDVFGYKVTDPEYTKHHSLADVRTITETATDTDAQELLAETWDSPLTLTTFVQLFESLAGPTNTQSLKLPALQNSVIIIDEPQSLPLRWWRLISRLCDILTTKFNAHVIFMTATQPQLLNRLPHTPKPYPLIADTDNYYNFLGDHPRVKYTLHDSTLATISNSESETLNTIDAARHLDEESHESVLSVGNTITSVTTLSETFVKLQPNSISLNTVLSNFYAKDSTNMRSSIDNINALADELVAYATKSDATLVATLTTRLRPIDRKILLRAIDQLLNTQSDDQQLYVFSTQLIEAGVDISFASLYRDLAPISSVVQAAGRCNRSFKSETKTVTVWHLEGNPETAKTPADYVYSGDYNLLKPTTQTLKTLNNKYGSTLSEKEMVTIGIDYYYDALHTKTKPGEHNLEVAVDEANFKRLRENSLISDDYETIDVFIATTVNEKRLFNKLKLAQIEHRYSQIETLFDDIKPRIISVPIEDAIASSKLVEITNGLYYLDAHQYASSYRLDTAAGLSTDSVVTDCII